MDTTNTTLQYYNEQAASFVEGTINVEFSVLQQAFLEYIPNGGTIIDLGCGSGRDTKAFIDRGYNVIAVDGSTELCKVASEYAGIDVVNSTFQDFDPSEMCDGIWACASLLHLEKKDINTVISKLSKKINEGGCFYVSFKYGDFSGIRNGRYFTDLTESSFLEVIADIPGLEIIKHFITKDARKDRKEMWLNVFLRRCTEA